MGENQNLIDNTDNRPSVGQMKAEESAKLEKGIRNLQLDGEAGKPAKASFTYNAERVLGSGSFGIVYQAQVND